MKGFVVYSARSRVFSVPNKDSSFLVSRLAKMNIELAYFCFTFISLQPGYLKSIPWVFSAAFFCDYGIKTSEYVCYEYQIGMFGVVGVDMGVDQSANLLSKFSCCKSAHPDFTFTFSAGKNLF